MIEFRQLVVEDFGPYRGTHTLPFSRERGVWVIYGSNGRGKTSLLNAFRYAMYGHIQGRVGRIAPENMVNVVARSTDNVSRFRVSLTLVANGRTEWEITRTYDENRQPKERLMVSVGGHLLPVDQAHTELRNLLPPELSGFFLFDGEDLRRYEHLLDEHSESAEELQNAIERVLGIPILRRAAHAAGVVQDEATKKIAEHLKKNEKTRLAGKALTEAQELKEELATQEKEEKKSLKKIQDELGTIRERLRENERSRALAARLDQLEEDERREKERLGTEESRLQEVTSDLWKHILRAKCNEVAGMLRSQLAEMQDELDREAFIRFATARIECGDPATCPICGDEIDVSVAKARLQTLEEDAPSSDRVEVPPQVLRNRLQLMESLLSAGSSDVLLERHRRVEEIRLDLWNIASEIEDAENALTDLGASRDDVRALNDRRDVLVIQESKVKERLRQLREDIDGQDTAIQKIRKKIPTSGEPLDPAVEALEDLANSVKELFLQTAEIYRDRMRVQVEGRASRVFQGISAEKDYDGLKINEGYGLTIVDREQNPIPNRSAGYEHLVALSLLAALQSFSPHKGPIVVDSPFGRLDADNTERVMSSLSEIANQVVLLIYEGEFDRATAVETLDEELVQELLLKRVSARETSIATRQV